MKWLVNVRGGLAVAGLDDSCGVDVFQPVAWRQTNSINYENVAKLFNQVTQCLSDRDWYEMGITLEESGLVIRKFPDSAFVSINVNYVRVVFHGHASCLVGLGDAIRAAHQQYQQTLESENQ